MNMSDLTCEHLVDFVHFIVPVENAEVIAHNIPVDN